MLSHIPRPVISGFLVLFLAACNMPNGSVPPSDDGIVATKVALTLEAMTLPVEQNTLTSLIPPTLNQLSGTRTPSQLATKTGQPANTRTSTRSPTGTAGPKITQTPTLRPTNTPIPAPGTITGNIYGYPYGSVPSLAIVAYGQEPPFNYCWLITSVGSTYFAMGCEHLLPGQYQVVAYDSSDNRGGCTTLPLVVSDQTVNCDITNWGGGYRAKPSDVPSP